MIMMKLTVVAALLLGLVAAGCGVNKTYVQEQISASESRTDAQLSTLKDRTDANTNQLAKLQSLATELSEKTDLAINKAKGFEDYQIIWSGEITFQFDSWEITGAAEQTLMEAGDKMTAHPGSLVEIAGHTDHTGSAKYNLMLGDKRAAAAKRFLVDNFGISLYRMFTISYGEDNPAAGSDEKQSASRNRRVTLNIWGELN